MEGLLTEDQKENCCRVLLAGCNRRTACQLLGLDLADLDAIIERDVDLARRLLYEEARAELRHMSNVNKAAQDEKNWRCSVWWLDRLAAARKEAGAVAGSLPPAVRAALDRLAEIIATTITDPERRAEVLARLQQASDEAHKAAQRRAAEAALHALESGEAAATAALLDELDADDPLQGLNPLEDAA